MAQLVRDVHVISDLHLGGAPPDPAAATAEGRRGFRMMTQAPVLAAFVRTLASRPAHVPVELVVNGDFLDFLAERHDGEPPWRPFLYEPGLAAATFARIAGRAPDAEVFDALAALLAAGHGLTILLGNHDLELCLPEVRAALLARLGYPPTDRFRFLYDGEALLVGDALVEHGNLYDPANVVDHDGLRKLRARRSRRRYDEQEQVFTPPPGSVLVAQVMNPIKQDYAFIDLLKPEAEPLFALLLALEPSYQGVLGRLSSILLRTIKDLVRSTEARFERYVASTSAAVDFERPVGSAGEATALAQVLTRAGLSDAEGRALLAALSPPARADFEAPVSSVGARLKAAAGLAALLAAGDAAAIERRLDLVAMTLGALRDDTTWSTAHESRQYEEAAELLVDRPGEDGPRHVVFGHTHHAKDVTLARSGARYLNSGTWADLMAFPAELTSPDRGKARAALRRFADDLEKGELAAYRRFEPTYVRLSLRDDGRVDPPLLGHVDPRTGAP